MFNQPGPGPAVPGPLPPGPPPQHLPQQQPQQLRGQNMAYKLMTRNEPVPESIDGMPGLNQYPPPPPPQYMQPPHGYMTGPPPQMHGPHGGPQQMHIPPPMHVGPRGGGGPPPPNNQQQFVVSNRGPGVGYNQNYPPLSNSGTQIMGPNLNHSGGRVGMPNRIPQTEFRILELNKRLQNRPLVRQQNSIGSASSPMPNPHLDESLWWEVFTEDFFDDDATLTISLQLDDRPHRYTIGRTLIPRFFRSYFEGGVIDLQYNLRHPKESITPFHNHGGAPVNNMIQLDCDRTTIITHHTIKHQLSPSPSPPGGALQSQQSSSSIVVCTEGHLLLDFVQSPGADLMIKTWNFTTRSCREYFERPLIVPNLNANNANNSSLPLHMQRMCTRQGLTNATINYLRMCEILEPMQDLMYEYELNNREIDPKSCLKNILLTRWKINFGQESRPQANKRRKRSKATAVGAGGAGPTGSTTNKKSKAAAAAAAANSNNANYVNLNNANNCNLAMSSPSAPGGAPGGTFSLASQDVMVVGEPSLMGGDFGDDNERVITRMENAQYDPTASATSSIAPVNPNSNPNPAEMQLAASLQNTVSEQAQDPPPTPANNTNGRGSINGPPLPQSADRSPSCQQQQQQSSDAPETPQTPGGGTGNGPMNAGSTVGPNQLQTGVNQQQPMTPLSQQQPPTPQSKQQPPSQPQTPNQQQQQTPPQQNKRLVDMT